MIIMAMYYEKENHNFFSQKGAIMVESVLKI